MARKVLKRILPDRETLEQHKMLKALGPWLLHPGVWTLHRKSVAGGVAAGLFCGLFPAPFQMFGAVVASFLFHWNLPVAILTTLYTNPVTMIPLYLLGLKIGIAVLNAFMSTTDENGHLVETAFPPPPDFELSTPIDSFAALVNWGLGMGWPLVVGVFILATGLALIGYLVTRIGWNIWIRLEVRKRRKRHQR